MNRPLALLFLAAASSLGAQTTGTTPTADAPAPTPASATAAAPSSQPSYNLESRPNSHISAQLFDSMPKYSPPKPPPPPQPTVDLRDIDKPRNGIKRLPKYVVHAARPPVFREKDIYTAEGLGDLGLKRYAGLNLNPLPLFSSNKAIAKQMVEDDERTDNINDLEDEAKDIGRGTKSDAAESDFIRKESTETYLRQTDWTPASPGH